MNGLRWPLPCILPERGDCCAFPKVLAHAGEDAQPLAGTSSLDLELRPQGLLSSRRPLSKGGYIRPWLAFKHIWRSGFSSGARSEEHTSELQSRLHLVCRLLLEKKKK